MRRSEESARRSQLAALKALASPVRLRILDWLKDPTGEFPAQVDGDLLVDGVCSDFIRDKLGLAASTTSRHLGVLADAGLLVSTRKRGWTFYRRDDDAIARVSAQLREL